MRFRPKMTEKQANLGEKQAIQGHFSPNPMHFDLHQVAINGPFSFNCG